MKLCSNHFHIFQKMLRRSSPKQKYDFFLILDFEATCEKGYQLEPREIIEFPCLKVDSRTHRVVSRFHEYVQPVHHPTLSYFCTKLTGIIQSTVDESRRFPAVMDSFNDWMRREGLLDEDVRSLFVTCGDWDLKMMLPLQCQLSGVQPPPYMDVWANVKTLYADVERHWPRSMMSILESLKVPHVGRHHSGVDDCRNIAAILQHLCVERGLVVSHTASSTASSSV